ncbi:Low temperature viability protein [Calocera viscosa TUFC12733]|uniref:Low temperature viability protein n=1 Tax=Calocera viscosa (strain TUFC12733) TaxID=1330018 RepID=A0A167FNQ5_CALVF|nr:Low temperature viability protein [Calocera viscosa TUFC12733]
MPPKSKSIFRQPGVQHFQLVHRSQRDPRINDPSASKHVLKGFERGNVVKKGKSRAELESILGEEAAQERANVGEAAVYGIYFDDTEYDYMQHLRPIGDADEGVIDSVLLEAPEAAKSKSKSKGKGKGKAVDLELRLPADSLPSEKLRSQTEAQDSLLSIPQSLAGFRPDMDPHLRQTLEALEDDAFVVDDQLETGEEDPEDWFGALLEDGEVDGDEGGDRREWEFEEWGLDDQGRPEGGLGEGEGDEEVDDLARRVKAFQLAQARAEGLDGGSEVEGEEEEEVEEIEVDESEMNAIRSRLAAFQISHKEAASDAWSDEERDEFRSEAGSTLPPLPVIGGKRRRPGAYSDASGFSMSSSSIWRSAGQKMVDDRFDEVEKAYEEGASDEDEEEEDEDENDEPPNLVNSRADFEAVIDGFMQQYEQVGNHVRPTSEKLDTLRRAMGEDLRLNGIPTARVRENDDEDILMPVDVDEIKDTWDVESILSTYSNLENHPRVISAREDVGRGVKRIRLDNRTGLPTVEEEGAESKRSRRPPREEQPSPEKRQKLAPKVPIARSKDESAEEKKARKAAVKQERQERRADKKATKTAFSTERKHQLKNGPAVSIAAVAMKL